MKIDRIISSCNENETYLSFLKITSKAWFKILNKKIDLAFISSKNESDPLVIKMKEYANVYLFKPIEGIDSGIQAKISRMILATFDEFNDKNCMIVDLDMIPLNSIVVDIFKHAPENHFIQWGGDHPAFSYGTPDYGKWPMDRTTAPGRLFKEIVNPKNLDYSSLINSWKNFNKFGKESVSSKFENFSDESLLRALHYDWINKNNTFKLPRSLIENSTLSGRIDRSKSFDPKIKEKLASGEYFESHGMRPFDKNISFYKEILEHLNLSIKDVIGLM